MSEQDESAAAAPQEVPEEVQQRLFEALAHGDDKHRQWLRQAIADFFAGRPVERPA